MWKTIIDELYNKCYASSYGDMRFIQMLCSCNILSSNLLKTIIFTPNKYTTEHLIFLPTKVYQNRDVFNNKILEILRYFPKEYLDNIMSRLVLGKNRFYEESETTYKRLREILDALD